MTRRGKGIGEFPGDPYSVYMDPKMYKELMLETKGSFGGVGIVLGVKEKMLTVVAPIESTPAEAAGILSGDQILRIDARTPKICRSMKPSAKYAGPEGSQVKLLIQRAGQEPKEYLLTRATIQLKTVSGKILEEDIGYIRLSMFSETTGNDFIQKLQELKSQGMKALILDLRNNPGGLIGESVKVAGQLVPKGPVVSVINKDGARETLTSSLETPVGPLVVLINGGSASASEIVAGAVQDTNTENWWVSRHSAKAPYSAWCRLTATPQSKSPLPSIIPRKTVPSTASALNRTLSWKCRRMRIQRQILSWIKRLK